MYMHNIQSFKEPFMDLLIQNSFKIRKEFIQISQPNNQNYQETSLFIIQKIKTLMFILLFHFLIQMNKIMLIILTLQNLMNIMLKKLFYQNQ